MKYFFLLFSISIILFSCKKKSSVGKEVEIYLLKTYQSVTGKCQVSAATAVLQDTAAISNSNIVAYSRTDYTFEFTNAGFTKVKAFKDRNAFAVTVDKQVIYYGFFKPNISSSSCPNSITMNSLVLNQVAMNLGYVGTSPDIDDQRNNPRLIATLSAQGKLR